MLPQFKNILVTTDFSQKAWMAMRYAASLAKDCQAQVSCLHVLPEVPKELSYIGGPSLLYGYGPGEVGVPHTEPTFRRQDEKSQEQAQRENLLKAEEMAKDHIKSLWLKLKAEFGAGNLRSDQIIIRSGNPVERILDVANNETFDLVVMGRRGHGKLRGPRIGGVANGVLVRSYIPVMIVGKKG